MSHLTGGAGGRAVGPQTVFRTSSRAKATGLFPPRDPYQWILVSGLVQFELGGERKHVKRTATLGEVNHNTYPSTLQEVAPILDLDVHANT